MKTFHISIVRVEWKSSALAQMHRRKPNSEALSVTWALSDVAIATSVSARRAIATLQTRHTTPSLPQFRHQN